MPTKYINPFTDFGFKKIFGEEPNKDLLIDFLNVLLGEFETQIKTLKYKKNEHLGATEIDRKVVFDLYCENEQGEKFIVEMQKAGQKFFKDRLLYYSTFPIQEQAQKGKDWNYQLKAVYAVAILDFTLDEPDKNKSIITQVQLIDRKTQNVFYEKLAYILIQIPLFDKNIDELENRLDQWLYVLKHLEKFERIPEKLKDKIFKKLFKIAEYQALTKRERMAYEESIKSYRDLKNSLDTALEKGFKKAEEKYQPLLKQAKHREEQAKLREEQAKHREKEISEKLAKILKESGKNIDEIVRETGLSYEDIEKL